MRTVAGSQKKTIDLIASALSFSFISCVGRADNERDMSMDRSRERSLVGANLHVRPNRHISLGWTPGCPSVPRTPVEEPGHAGDARKAPGPCRGCPQGTGVCPQGTGVRHRNALRNEVNFGVDSVTGPRRRLLRGLGDLHSRSTVDQEAVRRQVKHRRAKAEESGSRHRRPHLPGPEQ